MYISSKQKFCMVQKSNTYKGSVNFPELLKRDMSVSFKYGATIVIRGECFLR